MSNVRIPDNDSDGNSGSDSGRHCDRDIDCDREGIILEILLKIVFRDYYISVFDDVADYYNNLAFDDSAVLTKN